MLQDLRLTVVLLCALDTVTGRDIETCLSSGRYSCARDNKEWELVITVKDQQDGVNASALCGALVSSSLLIGQSQSSIYSYPMRATSGKTRLNSDY